MLIGLCASMIDPQSDPAGLNCLEPLAKLGFDYIELSLCHLAALPDAEFAAAVKRVRDSRLPCRACNNFFPPTIRLTGPEARLDRTLEYARGAVARAQQLGAEIIVFGSSGAKNVPPGFPLDQARPQIVELLKQLGPLAQSHGITIVIEPISRPESNVILTAGDGLQLMQEVDHPHVRLLVDYYHLRTESEDDAIITQAGNAIQHLHIGGEGQRRFPVRIDSGMLSFAAHLRSARYAGGISIEAFTDDFLKDARDSLACLRELFGSSGRPQES